MAIRPAGNHFKRFPLKIVLIVPFILLTVSASGLVGYFSFCNGQKAVNDVSAQLRCEIHQRIEAHLHAFLETPHRINEMNAADMNEGILDPDNPEMLERRFWRQVGIFSSVTSIYFGNARGGIANSGREGAGDSRYLIATDGFKRGPFRKYAADEQGNRSRLLNTVPDFDARTRQWYAGAAEKGAAVWSPAYILFTGQDLAVAASRPVYDKQNALVGVLSADIFLSHISRFLSRLDIGKTGQAFIMERSGLLIASSTGEKLFAEAGKKEPHKRLQATESDIPIIAFAARSLAAYMGGDHDMKQGVHIEFDIDGRRQFLFVSPFQDAYGLDWLIAVVVPEADFMDRIHANNRVTGLLILAALAVSGIIGLFIVEKISRPISMLDASSRILARGEWTKDLADDGRIAEINNLTRSFNKMANHLWQMLESLNQEISERKKAEKMLRESEEKFRSIFDNSLDGILFTGPDGPILAANPAAYGMLGWSDEEILDGGRSLITNAADPGFAHALEERTRTGRFRGELDLRRKDGTTFCADISSAVFKLANGDTRAYIIFRDATQRKRAAEAILENENRLHRLEKAESLGRMAGAIAHHFNNQLAVVLGNLELALDDVTDDPAIREFLAEAVQAGRRASELSRMMLIYLGQRTGRREPLDLSDVCRSHVPGLRESLQKGIVFETHFMDHGPVVSANGNEIRLILSHLIENSAAAIGDGPGKITLAVRTIPPFHIPHADIAPIDWTPEAEMFACLEVTDTGCGISEDAVNKIFDPFFTTKFSEKGLGLAVVLGIVKAWGGAVGVESRIERGTVFRVYLPVAEHAVGVFRPAVKKTGTHIGVKGGTVLLVDDQDMVRLVAVRMLEHLGFSVIEAAGGAEALELFRQHHDGIICVITDLTMPGMDGWEVLSALRRIQPELPVILASGYDETQAMDRDGSDSPNTFLHKPYTRDELRSALAIALGIEDH